MIINNVLLQDKTMKQVVMKQQLAVSMLSANVTTELFEDLQSKAETLAIYEEFLIYIKSEGNPFLSVMQFENMLILNGFFISHRIF